MFSSQPKQVRKGRRRHRDLCWALATQIVYTGFAAPYCRVYVAHTSATAVRRLLCREARHSLRVQQPSHFWMARVFDRGGIELFLWYARHELRVAARRQKLVHR